MQSIQTAIALWKMDDMSSVLPTVTHLWIYPIKSCRGIAVPHFTLDDRGPELDRRWMLVDRDNVFMTQREHPRMALIDVAVSGRTITVSAPTASSFSFGMTEAFNAEACVVWQDTIELQHVSRGADRWFSNLLGVECRLMRMPATTERVVDRQYWPEARLVTLADGYPMLLIGSGSLELLNEKLAARGESEVPIERFRPNIFVARTRPHEEDEWQTIRIGDVACNIVKPCERCAITTVDTRTGVKGKEPLRTLSEYRRDGSKVLFGQNVIHTGAGAIHVGDAISSHV